MFALPIRSWLKKNTNRKPRNICANPPRLEVLEDRTMPAQLTQFNAQLTYQAQTGEVNNLQIYDLGSTIEFREASGVAIFTGISGATGSGTSDVMVPSSGIMFVQVFLGDQTDSLAVNVGAAGGSVTLDQSEVTLPSFDVQFNISITDVEALQVNGSTGAVNLAVNNALIPTTVVGSTGNDSITVTGNSPSGPLTLRGNDGNDQFVLIAGSLDGNISVTGGVLPGTPLGADTMDVKGTSGDDVASLTSNALTGFSGGQITYDTLNQLDVFGLDGNDLLNVIGTSLPTSIQGGNGNDTVNVQSTSTLGPVTIDGGTGQNLAAVTSAANQISIIGESGVDSVSLGNASSTLPIQAALSGGFDQLSLNNVASTIQLNAYIEAITVGNTASGTLLGTLQLEVGGESINPVTTVLTVNNGLNIQGTVTGSGGLVVQGTGTTNLSGNNDYTGTTRLMTGNLIVNGQQGSSPVSLQGGLLAGVGKVGSLNGSGGTLQPDNPGSPGQALSVLGNVNLSSQVTFLAVINSSGPAFTPMMVTGSVTLNNTMLTIVGDISKTNGQLALIDAGGGVFGTFILTAGSIPFGASGAVVINGGVISVVLTTADVRNDINSVYLDLLNRPVDPPGQTFWQNELKRLQQDRLVTNAFLAFSRELATSQEYLQLVVTTAYLEILGRNPDPMGLTFFVNFLRLPAINAAEAAANPGASPDATIAVLRNAFLAANPGATFKLATINLHASISDVRAALRASDEYFATKGGGDQLQFLQTLYVDVLHRGIDPSGQNVFLAALKRGASRAQIVAGIMHSTEALTAVVTGLYQHFLRRSPDPTGLQSLLFALQHGFTEERLEDAFLTSQEYFTLHKIGG